MFLLGPQRILQVRRHAALLHAEESIEKMKHHAPAVLGSTGTCDGVGDGGCSDGPQFRHHMVVYGNPMVQIKILWLASFDGNMRDKTEGFLSGQHTAAASVKLIQRRHPSDYPSCH